MRSPKMRPARACPAMAAGQSCGRAVPVGPARRQGGASGGGGNSCQPKGAKAPARANTAAFLAKQEPGTPVLTSRPAPAGGLGALFLGGGGAAGKNWPHAPTAPTGCAGGPPPAPTKPTGGWPAPPPRSRRCAPADTTTPTRRRSWPPWRRGLPSSTLARGRRGGTAARGGPGRCVGWSPLRCLGAGAPSRGETSTVWGGSPYTSP